MAKGSSEQTSYLKDRLRKATTKHYNSLDDNELPEPEEITKARELLEKWKYSKKTDPRETKMEKVAEIIREKILFGHVEEALSAIKEFEDTDFTKEN